MKTEKVGELGYLYRGLLIAKRDSWATWEPRYSIQSVRENILFLNAPGSESFIPLPKSSNLATGFRKIKEAKEAIDLALSNAA